MAAYWATAVASSPGLARSSNSFCSDMNVRTSASVANIMLSAVSSAVALTLNFVSNSSAAANCPNLRSSVAANRPSVIEDMRFEELVAIVIAASAFLPAEFALATATFSSSLMCMDSMPASCVRSSKLFSEYAPSPSRISSSSVS